MLMCFAIKIEVRFFNLFVFLCVLCNSRWWRRIDSWKTTSTMRERRRKTIFKISRTNIEVCFCPRVCGWLILTKKKWQTEYLLSQVKTPSVSSGVWVWCAQRVWIDSRTSRSSSRSPAECCSDMNDISVLIFWLRPYFLVTRHSKLEHRTHSIRFPHYKESRIKSSNWVQVKLVIQRTCSNVSFLEPLRQCELTRWVISEASVTPVQHAVNVPWKFDGANVSSQTIVQVQETWSVACC